MTEQESLVLLSALPGIGAARLRQLLEHFGGARQALSAKPHEFARAGNLPASTAQKIYEFDRDIFLQTEYNLIRKFGVSIVTIFDEHYPRALREIHDAPVVLYVRGRLPGEDDPAIAVVGSRKASDYGLSVAQKFSGQLAELGITIVSGLARGIDTAAHQGCLRTGGRTVAVVGCGLAHIYPAENRELFEDIARKGAVISELPMATPPISFNFPGRNRIISGLSMAVLVVEASQRSGALITSHFALEQGRDVFAVPGKIDQPNSQGVNQLIKDGAKLVMSFEDILQELDWQLRPKDNMVTKTVERPLDLVARHCNEDERIVAEALSDEPVYIDEVASRAGRPLAEVANILLKLELKKYVRQLPGKYFVRT